MPTQPAHQERASLCSRLWLRALPVALVLLSTLAPARALAASDCGLSRIVAQVQKTTPTYSSSSRWEQLDWQLGDGVELDDGALTLTVPPGTVGLAATGRTFTNSYVEVEIPLTSIHPVYHIFARAATKDGQFSYVVFKVSMPTNSYSIELGRPGGPGMLADSVPLDPTLSAVIMWSEMSFGILTLENLVGFTINGRLVDWVEEVQVYEDVADFQTGSILVGAENVGDDEIVVEMDPIRIWDLDRPAGGVDLTTDCEIIGNIVQQGKAARATTPAFSDDFGRDVGRWSLPATTAAALSIVDGVMVLDFKKPNWVDWAVPSNLFASYYVFEADATQTGGERGSKVGLLVDYVDNKNFTLLQVSSEGEWSAQHFARGTWLPQVSPTAHDAINAGVGSDNRLTAIAAGSYLLFLVNDELVGWIPRRLTTEGHLVQNGGVALAASTAGANAATASFDNVRLWVLPETEP